MDSNDYTDVLDGLMKAWISWDFDDFMNLFFVKAFPRYDNDFHRHKNGSYKMGAYRAEKFRKFQSNPASFMCEMDNNTKEEFSKAITLYSQL